MTTENFQKYKSNTNTESRKSYMHKTIANAIGRRIVGLLGLELERREMRAELRVIIDIRRDRRWLLGQWLRNGRDFRRNARSSGAISFGCTRHL